MGCSASTELTQHCDSCARQYRGDEYKLKWGRKIAIIGESGAGKSTLYRQILGEYEPNRSEEEEKEQRVRYRVAIAEYTIKSMKTLIRQSQERSQPEASCRECDENILDIRNLMNEVLPEDLTNIVLQYTPMHQIDSSLECFVEMVSETNDELNSIESETIDPYIASAIQALWEDSGIKLTFEHRLNSSWNTETSLLDNSPHFFEKLNIIRNEKYVPTSDDILHCYDYDPAIHTSRIYMPRLREHFWVLKSSIKDPLISFTYQNKQSSINGAVFMVALSEYDQMCSRTNKHRLSRSLSTFRFICNKWKDIPIFLFFNKIKLTKEKLKRGIPFQWGCYSGKQSYLEIAAFVRRAFEDADEWSVDLSVQFGNAIDNDFDVHHIFQHTCSRKRLRKQIER